MTELEARRPVLIDPYSREARDGFDRWCEERGQSYPWPKTLRRLAHPIHTDNGLIEVVAWMRGWLAEWVHFPPVHAGTLASRPAYDLFESVAKVLFSCHPITKVTFGGGKSQDRTKLARLRISDRCVTHGRLLAGLPPLPMAPELAVPEKLRKMKTVQKEERKPDGVTAHGTPLFG